MAQELIELGSAGFRSAGPVEIDVRLGDSSAAQGIDLIDRDFGSNVEIRQ
jgi:hypothetical protein